MKLFKVLGAGLSSWGETLVKNWWKILLGILAIPVFGIIVSAFGYYGAKGLNILVQWSLTIPWWVNLVTKHPLALILGMIGLLYLAVGLKALYQSGQKKLEKAENDKVSSI